MKLLKTMMFVAAASVASPSMAALALFDISDGTFSDGATFDGTFEYDPVTKAFGSYSVTATAGNLPAITYTGANSGAYSGGGAGPNNFILFLDNGSRYFNFSFLSPLVEGTQAINVASSYDCNNCGTFRRVTAGSVSSVAAVPEPATWAMMLLGFGAIGASMRRRRRVTAIAQMA